MNMGIASIAINFLISLSMLANEDLPESARTVIFFIMLIFVAISAAGLFMYKNSKKKSHAIMAIVGFAIFVPIGLIGVFGVRKMMDAEAEEKFMQDQNNE